MPVHPKKDFPANIKFEKPLHVTDPSAAGTAASVAGLKGGKGNPSFLAACQAEGVTPSKRQARKWLANVGRWAPNKRIAS